MFENSFIDFLYWVIELQCFKFWLAFLQHCCHILWLTKVRALDFDDSSNNSCCSFTWQCFAYLQVCSKQCCILVPFLHWVTVFQNLLLSSALFSFGLLAIFKGNSVSPLVSRLAMWYFGSQQTRKGFCWTLSLYFYSRWLWRYSALSAHHLLLLFEVSLFAGPISTFNNLA